MTSNRFIYLILSAFIAGNLLLIFIQYNSSKSINNLIAGNHKLLDELKIANELRELERDMLSVESKIRGAAATGDSNYLEDIGPQIKEAKHYLDSLKTINEPDSTMVNINQLDEIADEKLVFANRVNDSLRNTGRISPASFKMMMAGRKMLERRNIADVNTISRKIYTSRERSLDSLTVSTDNSGKEARKWGTFMIVLVLVSGAALFWYIISRIRKQNHLIEQLDASEKKEREAYMIKENFMANMSHEIRTPLNAILGFANLLKTKNRDPELTEFVESISVSGHNLLTIINEILDLSKIEAGMMRIESASFNIRQLVHSIQMMFAEKINEKGLKLSVAIHPGIPELLSGDATRLTQILVNMIENAVKFTQEGTIDLEINNKGLSGNQIRIEFIIRDTGIGIEQEKLPGIFERFRQAEDSITRKYGGTGLGLSIVKELVVLQKGEIKVESTIGEGSVFSFIIPYEIIADQMTLLPSDGSGYFGDHDFVNLHILVVEDNKMNQKLLRHLLHEWKLSADIVNNGLEALESLQNGKYDLVLMDIQMPEMDGYTAAEEIRRTLKLDIPIIAMTAHAFAGEREKCLSYGMNDYISKPINEKELGRLIKTYTGMETTLQDFKKKTDHTASASYKFITLEYMSDISNGNKEFERTATEQFIEAIPIDLEDLELAFANRDFAAIQKIAHSMKTDISMMGLSEKLSSSLDELETEVFDEQRFQEIIAAIKNICLNALSEARHFYSTL